MLKELGEYFDHYIVKARFLPVCFAFFPLALTLSAWYPDTKNMLEDLLVSISFIGVMKFVSMNITSLGGRCEKRLFLIWGGAPTTIILRHSDQTLDKYTKQRYHKWLDGKVDGLNLPNAEVEEEDPNDADQKYQSAIKFLLEYSRDRKKYPGVHRDNVSYGFVRNLLAIRAIGLSVALLCIVINLYFLWAVLALPKAGIDTDVLNNHILGIVAVIASIVLFLVFLLCINNSFVKERGLRYAKTLLESCEAT